MKRLPLYPSGIPRLEVEGVQPIPLDSACTRCKLRETVTTVCMPAQMDGADHGGSMLLVVGEGPGRSEDLRGIPFVGASGDYLRRTVRALWSGPVVYDNAVRCAPGARDVGRREIEACRPFLAGVLREAAPARILAVGGAAIASLTGISHPVLSVRRGYALTAEGVPVYFVLHPAAALRNRFVKAWFEEDVRWALTAPLPAAPPLAAEAWVIETVAEAQEAVAELRLAKAVGFDTETFGAMHDLEFRVDTLAAADVDADVSYVWTGVALRDRRVLEPLLDLLADPQVSKVGQNVKFDAEAVELAFGVRVRGVAGDARLLRKLIQADASGSLEDMQPLIGMAGGKREMDEALVGARKEIRQLARKKPEDLRLWLAGGGARASDLFVAASRVREGRSVDQFAYGMVDSDLRARYCATDVLSTNRLFRHLESRVRAEPGLRTVWSEITLGLSEAVTRMELNGVGVSIEAIRALQARLAVQQAELEARLAAFDHYFPERFNPNSAAQVAALLGKLGVQLRVMTERGAYATGADVLEKIDHPVAADIMAYRRVIKFRSNYADGMEEFIRDDGRIHPDIWIDGTETGRPSCKQPNVFNIPRAETVEGRMCRDIFAAREGWEIIESDFNQIELRKAADLSGDEKMIALFVSGADFHLETARLIAPIFGVDPAAVTKAHPLRNQAKTVNFATLYGDPPAGLAAKLGISVKKAIQLQEAILGQFMRLRAWINEQLRYARQTGHCRTFWAGQPARIRPLWKIADGNEDIRANAERSSYNSPVQGSAADHTNRALGLIQRWLDATGEPALLVLTVYDSILLEVRKDRTLAVARHVRDIMVNSGPSRVPLKVDVKRGPSWGSLEGFDL